MSLLAVTPRVRGFGGNAADAGKSHPRACEAGGDLRQLPRPHQRAHPDPRCASTVTRILRATCATHHGFHGRMPNAGVGECRACHTEHKGREADIVQLDRAQFDHRLTDFALEGAHAALECASCHKKGEAWRKAPATCAGCHKADDVHRGQFTQSCGECHGSLSWSGGKFDHDKTEFKLTGAHLTVTCDACHIGGRYKPTPKSCVGCHATDDEHRGSRGAGLRQVPRHQGVEDREVRSPEGDRLRAARCARGDRLPGLPSQRQLQGQDSQGLQWLPSGR